MFFRGSLDLNLDNIAEIAHLFLEQIGVSDYLIVGHSTGGMIGLKYVKKHPDKVLAYSNVEGGLTLKDVPLSETISSTDKIHFIQQGFKDLVTRLLATTNPGTRKYAEIVARFTDPASYYEYARATVKSANNDVLIGVLQEIAETRIPVLCVLGDQNQTHGINEAAKDLSLESAIISGSGHFSFTDNPYEFYSRLAVWINTWSR